MILHYFLVGMRELLSYGIVRIAAMMLGLFALLILYRRLVITLQSGSRFCSSYKITNGFFYIHSGIVPGNRKILLKNINQVTIHLVRGRIGNGNRYHIELGMKKGGNKTFLVGKSKRTVGEIAEMQKLLKKNKVKVSYYDYTKV